MFTIISWIMMLVTTISLSTFHVEHVCILVFSNGQAKFAKFVRVHWDMSSSGLCHLLTTSALIFLSLTSDLALRFVANLWPRKESNSFLLLSCWQ